MHFNDKGYSPDAIKMMRFEFILEDNFLIKNHSHHEEDKGNMSSV